MPDSQNFVERHGLQRVLNAIGTPTIIGANVVPAEVRAVVDEVLTLNVEIDELQRAACRAIARATGAEAGCVTSSCSSGLAVAAAAAMTGADLAKITRLPDAGGMPDEVVLPLAHDVNFGGEVRQMLRLSGARVVYAGTANHCDLFHLRGAISERTAAVFYVSTDVVNPAGDFPPVEEFAAIAHERNLPLIVDAAAARDVRPFLRAGAALVITSAHKAMGAPTSGMLCGRRDLIRACYLQNWGIGRAMKVGKEGIAGCMAAVERWYARDEQAEKTEWRRRAEALRESVSIEPGPAPFQVRVPVDSAGVGLSPRQAANALREGDPAVWVHAAEDHALILDLRVMSHDDARRVGQAVAAFLANPRPPREDVPYHDLYWSAERLLRWPGEM